MNVACITHHRYPTDQEIRVTKFSGALANAGHHVTVLSPGNAEDPATDTFEHGVIERLVRTSNRLGQLVLGPSPLSLIWVIWLWMRIGADAIEVVIVRDLRLSLPTILAAKLRGVPVILDLGEHYPGLVEILGRQRLGHWVTRNPQLVGLIERMSARFADIVWVVVDENRDRIARHNARTIVVNNYPDVTPARGPLPISDPTRIVSLGIVDNIRGLDLALDALAKVIQHEPDAHLVVFGDGPFRPTLEAQVVRLGLAGHVSFEGWIPGSRKYEVLSQGGIGLILHRVCALTNHTLPNKLFDYMSVGMPVVSTPMEPVRRIVEREACGLVVNETPQAVATALLELIADPSLQSHLGEQGRAAASRYQWDTEAATVVESVEALGDRPRSHRSR